MVSLVEETFTDMFCDFWETWTLLKALHLRGICLLSLLVWGGSPPLSLVAAVVTAIATPAATFVVVEAAIAYIRPVFDLFIFPDTLKPGILYLCVRLGQDLSLSAVR